MKEKKYAKNFSIKHFKIYVLRYFVSFYFLKHKTGLSLVWIQNSYFNEILMTLIIKSMSSFLVWFFNKKVIWFFSHFETETLFAIPKETFIIYSWFKVSGVEETKTKKQVEEAIK